MKTVNKHPKITFCHQLPGQDRSSPWKNENPFRDWVTHILTVYLLRVSKILAVRMSTLALTYCLVYYQVQVLRERILLLPTQKQKRMETLGLRFIHVSFSLFRLLTFKTDRKYQQYRQHTLPLYPIQMLNIFTAYYFTPFGPMVLKLNIKLHFFFFFQIFNIFVQEISDEKCDHEIERKGRRNI